MKLRALVLVGTVGLLVAASPQDEAKKDAQQIQGTWVPISATKNGQDRPKERLDKTKFVITADKIAIEEEDKKEPPVSYTLDPTKKPKAIEITLMKGTEKGPTIQGIYELEGDTLKLCFGQPGKARPKEFASKEGSDAALVILKRAKP